MTALWFLRLAAHLSTAGRPGCPQGSTPGGVDVQPFSTSPK